MSCNCHKQYPNEDWQWLSQKAPISLFGLKMWHKGQVEEFRLGKMVAEWFIKQTTVTIRRWKAALIPEWGEKKKKKSILHRISRLMKVFQKMNLAVTACALQKYMDALQDFEKEFEMPAMLPKHVKPDWTSRCRPFREVEEQMVKRSRPQKRGGLGGGGGGWKTLENEKKKRKKKDALVSQVYLNCGYQRQCPRNISYEKQNKQKKKKAFMIWEVWI